MCIRIQTKLFAVLVSFVSMLFFRWIIGWKIKTGKLTDLRYLMILVGHCDVKTKPENQLDDVTTLRVSGNYAHAQVALTSTNETHCYTRSTGNRRSRITQECYLCTRLATNEIKQPGKQPCHCNEYCHVRSWISLNDTVVNMALL